MKLFSVNKPKFTLLAALVIALGLISLAVWRGSTRQAEAQAGVPFCGPILYVTYCCNGVMLTVGPPREVATLMWYWGSPLWAYYNIFEPGPWVLGTYAPVGECQWLYAFPPCVYPVVTTGSTILIGTSGL